MILLFAQYTFDQSSQTTFQSNSLFDSIFDSSKKSTVALLQSTFTVSTTSALYTHDLLIKIIQVISINKIQTLIFIIIVIAIFKIFDEQIFVISSRKGK